MKNFKEELKMYNDTAKEESIVLTEDILSYLNSEYKFIIKIDTDNDYYGMNDMTVHPENGCSYLVQDEDSEVCCFFVANGKYVIMIAGDHEYYYEGKDSDEFASDFASVLRRRQSLIDDGVDYMKESCLRRLNEFKMNLATFDIGEDFIEVCEKQNVKDFKDISNILKQVFDNRTKKQ